MGTSYIINVLILLSFFLSWTRGLSDYTPAGYIGCYDDKALGRLHIETDISNTGDRCIQHCLSSRFRYAATQNTSFACGNQLRDEYPIAKKCYVECPGNRNEVCGGLSNQMSFYDIWETTTSTIATSNTQTTTSTLAATTNTQTTGTTRRTEIEHRTHTEMYISIPATAAIVGITAVVVLCIFFRRKGRTHDLSGGTDRVNQLDTVTETEIKVTKDDDSVHLYEDCDEFYHSNSGYLTPIMDTTSSRDNRNSNSGYLTPIMDTTSSRDNRSSNSGYPTPFMNTTFSQANRSSGYPTPLMDTTSSKDNRNSNSSYLTPFMDTTSSQDNRNSNSGYPTPLMDTTCSQDNRNSNSGYMTPLMDTTSSRDNRSSNSGYPTPFMNTTFSQANRSSISGYLTPLTDTTSSHNKNHDTQYKDSTYLHPVSSTSAPQTGGENCHNPTIGDAEKEANMYQSVDD